MIVIPSVKCTAVGSKFSLSGHLTYSYSTPAGNVVLNSTGTVAGTIAKGPATLPSGIEYFVPITIDNTQPTATSSPFQQMVNASSSVYNSYAAGNLQNVEFFYSNGTIIPSWLENYNSAGTLWWLKLGSIPASSSITVYMGFANTITNLFNNKTTGEAPSLSQTYGEYNNIENVMDQGLVYQIYYDSSGACDSTGYQTQLYNSILADGTTVAGCTSLVSSTSPFTTALSGTSQDVDGTTESNVIINYQEGYSGGAAYPNPPVLNPANSWLIKAIGWAEVSSPTVFYEFTDDGITLSSVSSSTADSSGKNWLGGTSSPNNLISEWYVQGGTLYSSPTVAEGVYRLEMDYFEYGGFAYTALWSNNTVEYYHADYPPNGVMPSVEYGVVS